MRKTKIICTMGPAVDNEEMLRALMLTGMDAARFNFSHGTHESHLATLNKVRRIRDELGAAVATILDTKGPEIRIKTFENGPVTHANLHNELTPGCRVLIDDGLIELTVDGIQGQDIACTVRSGGTLSNNKSINIPGVSIHLPSLTEKDRDDLRFAAEQDFDFVAASFVRKASDVEDIRACLRECGGEHIRIISKIENREGVDNLEEIIAASDGLMVARGDLGVEIPAYEVPILQKRMIKETSMAGKPVITATQMLDSMIRNPRPTRAEVSDVANAVFDGTSCVMLSGETASGKHPVEAVQTMVDTINAAEQATDYWGRFRRFEFTPGRSINDAVTHTCCQTAMDLEADAILTPTQTGHTARMIARFRPACPIVALTTTERARRQLAISWGVQPLLAGYVDSTDRLFSMCVQSALKEGAVQSGQMVVITAGVPIGRAGSTNLIKAQVV